MSGRPVATRRQRTRNAVGVVAVVGLVPLAVFLAIARAWVVPALVVIAFAAAAAAALAWLGPGRRLPPPDSEVTPPYTPPAAHDERITRIRRSLDQALKDETSYEKNVRPVLTRLADERLRNAHGITMTTHPDAARARLGEELWQRLTSTSDRPPTEAELRRLVATLDRLSPRS